MKRVCKKMNDYEIREAFCNNIIDTYSDKYRIIDELVSEIYNNLSTKTTPKISKKLQLFFIFCVDLV